MLSGGTGRLIETKRTNGLFIAGPSTAASYKGHARKWNRIDGLSGNDSKIDGLVRANNRNIANYNVEINLSFLPFCEKLAHFFGSLQLLPHLFFVPVMST